MNKNEIEKNYLDLLYQKNLQYLSAVLIVGVGSLIAFFSGLILNLDKWIFYISCFISVGVITFKCFKLSNKSLNKISEKIRNLKVDEQ